MRSDFQKSSLEEALIKKDYGILLRYARHIVISSNRIPDSDKTGIPREDFINEVAYRGIQYALTDYEKGLFDRERGPINSFIWFRVRMKAFFDVLEEYTTAHISARFDERLGKYYEGSAGHETAFCDEQDGDIPLETDDKKKKNEDEEERNPKEHGGEVERQYYYFSSEKERILEDNWNTKMGYVQKIKDLVSKMSPMDQRLFDIRFGFNLSEEDYEKIDVIQKAPHVKEYYNKLAAQEFGISEGAARKRVKDLLDYIKKNLTADGSIGSYRQNTSMPGLSEFRVVNPEPKVPEMNLDNLSEYDCIDILMGLKFQ